MNFPNNFKKGITIMILGTTILGTSNVLLPNNANAEEVTKENKINIPQDIEMNDSDLPQMPLSEALESGATEVILTDIDIPEAALELNSTVTNRDFMLRGKGKWVYKYTAQPYKFYFHTKKKKWKMVQVTAFSTHVQNVVVNGWMNTISGGSTYFR